jgi:hypothetical protein
LETMRSAGVELGQTTYFALLQAAIDNNQPISDILKTMQEKSIDLSEQQRVKMLYSLAKMNNTKLLSSVRFIQKKEDEEKWRNVSD